jgi:predicted Fe-Mo cluster-binding NifX family protein
MKIVMPITDNCSSPKQIANSFHNSNYVCIYNSQDQTFEWELAKKISPSPGNLGRELKRKGIGAVISRQMPLMALGFFAECGLPVFEAQGENIEENIRLFNLCQLQQLTAEMIKKVSACSGSCGSCSTVCKS